MSKAGAKISRVFGWIATWLRPTRLTRSSAHQSQVDRQTARLTLYRFSGCPYCFRVDRAIRRLGLYIEARNPRASAGCRRELVEGGGRYSVPCLRIDQGESGTEWLYESGDIVRYLEERFAAGEPLQKR